MILYFVYISRKDLFTVNMSKKTPPKFHSNMSYKTWTNKLEMCQIWTTLPKSEQAIIVLLDGNVQAEKAVENITANDMSNDNSMDY